jgi:hypothetical protein
MAVAPEMPVAAHVDIPKATTPAPVIEPLATPAPVKHGRLSRLLGFIDDEPARSEVDSDVDAPAAHAAAPRTDHWAAAIHSDDPTPSQSRGPAEPTAAPELADVLSEVASLAAPLERTSTPEAEVRAPERESATEVTRLAPSPWEEKPAPRDIEYVGAVVVPKFAADSEPTTPYAFDDDSDGASLPSPGRHMRRLHSQKPERRDWNPTLPVTGRHVLPLGGPAVGAADRDRRLWLFGAVTVVLILIGLLVGRQVTQTSPLVASTLPKPTAAVHASTPPTTAPLPVATPVPATLPVIPAAPTPQQLTSVKTLGTGTSGFSVADVRYGEHPNDFRLVFDMAFPATVSGDPDTVIGFDGPTTMYVEFTGVNGASDVATMPHGQVVVSVVALPMARDTGRLIFKITLSKKATFDAYYLSGARLVIDVT